MSRAEITVRQWQENYRAGAYTGKDTGTQRSAGWWDWHCRDDALAGRLKRIAPVVLGIKAPYILDGYTVWFRNERGDRHLLYDSAHFEFLGKDHDKKFFMVDLNNPQNLGQWALYTKRFGLFTPEFSCDRVREMDQYIDDLAHELEHDIRPPFVDERETAELYVLTRGSRLPSKALRREGDARYSFLDMDDGRRKTVYVARSLEDTPPGFRADRAAPVNGMYVYCPEDAEKILNIPSRGKKRLKKKEAER